MKLYSKTFEIGEGIWGQEACNADPITLSGTIGFMCPHCYEPILVDVDYHEKFIPLNLNTYLHYKREYTFICPSCKREFDWNDWPMDPNITRVISILNKKNYITKGSCEGHNDTNKAYIYFINNNYKQLFNNHYILPEMWEIDDEKFVNGFAIRCDCSKYSLEERITSIEEWAKNLPYFDKEYFANNMGIVLTDEEPELPIRVYKGISIHRVSSAEFDFYDWWKKSCKGFIDTFAARIT